MSVNLGRTADGWWAMTPAGMVRLGVAATTTAQLLADRAALDAAVDAAQTLAADSPHEAVPVESLDLLSPVTAPARVVAQMVNYRSHAAGLRPQPGHGPAGLLPQVLALHHRADRRHHPPDRGRVPRL